MNKRKNDACSKANAHFTSIEQYKDVESINYFRILLEQGLSREEALHIITERSRDNGRTPMQWTAEAGAGFTSGEPWIGIPENYTVINAAAEEEDPDSILHFYRMLVRLRKEKDIIALGTIRFLDTGNDKLIAYERNLGEETITVLCSFSAQRERVTDPGLARALLRGLKAGNVLACADTATAEKYRQAAPDPEGGELILEPYDGIAVLAGTAIADAK